MYRSRQLDLVKFKENLLSDDPELRESSEVAYAMFCVILIFCLAITIHEVILSHLLLLGFVAIPIEVLLFLWCLPYFLKFVPKYVGRLIRFILIGFKQNL